MVISRQCPKCKTTDSSNKSLVMMINECGHPICKNCVDNIFAKNSAPCPICGKSLRKNYYWEQKFDNPMIERELYHRKRLGKVYCLKRDEFPSDRAFDDYLERIEHLIFNLVEETDVQQTEAEIAAFKEKNADKIDKNRKKPSEDDLWIKQRLDEEDERHKRITAELNNEKNQSKKMTAEERNKEVVDMLRTGNLPAEVIVDKKRKEQIELEMLSRDEEKKKKVLKQAIRQEKVTFGTVTASGHPYIHVLPKLHISGPPLPNTKEIDTLGYGVHTPIVKKEKLAGGFTQSIGLTRYLFEARQDLFYGL